LIFYRLGGYLWLYAHYCQITLFIIDNRPILLKSMIKKEWYNKKDILIMFPIGVSTYKKRISKLNEYRFHNFTKLVKKNIENSNLKFTTERLIHHSIVNELFGNVRVPSLNNTEKIQKWINNVKWDWFCNIVPTKTYPVELKGKMNYFFSQLKKDSKYIKPQLFYSIEKNSKDDYYHCHFLLKTNGDLSIREELEILLMSICEGNSKFETRIFIKPYNHDFFQNRGVLYSSKDFSIDYNLLK